MAKKINLILIIILISVLSVSGKGIFVLSGNMFISSDDGFRDTYEKKLYFPGILVEYNISREFFIWTDFVTFSKAGFTIGDLQVASKTKRSSLSLGLGYEGNIDEKVKLRFKSGMTKITYTEEAMDDKINGNAIGIKIGSDILFKITKRFLVLINFGYTFGNDTLEIEGKKIDAKLSGFSSGLGVGIEF